MLCDSLGRPLRLLLTAGQKADCQSALDLLQGQRANAVVADKGYDTDSIRTFVRSKRMKVVVPGRCHRKRR